MLKTSKYVFLFQRDGKNFIYNSRTNSFYELPDEAFDLISRVKIGECSDIIPIEFAEDLRKAKILTTEEEEKRYLDFLRLAYLRSAFGSEAVNMTILPTVSCNLRCPYCFEQTKPAGVMSDETIGKLKSFVATNSRNGKYSITWFGGEPLTAVPVMRKILAALGEDEKYERTWHSIITNATLLDKEAIGLFTEYPLNSMQITLDGNRDTHNSKRFTATGGGTFDTILDNLSAYLDKIKDTHIDIRVNVDKSNKEEYLEVYELFSTRFKGMPVYLYPGILRANKGCGEENFFTSDDHLEFSKMLWRKNIRFSYPSHCSKGCCATSLSSYVIGPMGEMYLCWEHAGIKEKIVGYIDGKPGTDTDLYPLFKLHGHCFDDSRCLDCGLLPICSGGCPDKRVSNLLGESSYNLCTVYNDKEGEGLVSALYEYYLSNQRQNDTR